MGHLRKPAGAPLTPSFHPHGAHSCTPTPRTCRRRRPAGGRSGGGCPGKRTQMCHPASALRLSVAAAPRRPWLPRRHTCFQGFVCLVWFGLVSSKAGLCETNTDYALQTQFNNYTSNANFTKKLGCFSQEERAPERQAPGERRNRGTSLRRERGSGPAGHCAGRF